MAVARRSIGAFASGTASSISVAQPSGNAAGDVELLFVVVNSSTISTAPSGWTLLANVATTTASRTYVYWRYLSAATSTNTTFTLAASVVYRAVIVAYSGASSTVPSTSTQVSTFGFSSSSTFPSISAPSGGSSSMFGVWGIGASASTSVTGASTSGGSWGTPTISNSAGTRSLSVIDGLVTGGSSSTTFNATFNTSSAFNSALVLLSPGVVVSPPVANAGADATITLGDTFTRTGTDTNSPTARSWDITDGPTGVGSNIGTAAALSWTPTITGTYTLTYSATNSGGTATDDVIVTVNATTGTAIVASETWTGSNGAGWPSQWTTSQINGTNGSATIVSNKGRHTSASTATYQTIRSYLSGMSTVQDTDVTVKFTVNAQVECYPSIGLNSDGVPWASDGSYSQNGYIVVIQMTTSAATCKLEFTRMKNSVQTSMGALVTKTVTAGTQYQMRFQRNGTLVRLRMWQASLAEPSTWDFSVNETAANMPPAGKVGLNFQSGGTAAARTVDWDDLVVTDLNATPPPTGDIKAYVSGAFVAKPVKYWTGSAWVKKPVKQWTGSAWVVTNY